MRQHTRMATGLNGLNERIRRSDRISCLDRVGVARDRDSLSSGIAPVSRIFEISLSLSVHNNSFLPDDALNMKDCRWKNVGFSLDEPVGTGGLGRLTRCGCGMGCGFFVLLWKNCGGIAASLKFEQAVLFGYC